MNFHCEDEIRKDAIIAGSWNNDVIRYGSILQIKSTASPALIPNVVALVLNLKNSATITYIVIANHRGHGVHGDFNSKLLLRALCALSGEKLIYRINANVSLCLI